MTNRIFTTLLSLFSLLSCTVDNTVKIIELDKFKSFSGKYKTQDNRCGYHYTVLIKNPPENDDGLKRLMVQYFCRKEHYIDSIDPGCIFGSVFYYKYTSETAYFINHDQDPGGLWSNTLDMYPQARIGFIITHYPCKDDSTGYRDFMEAYETPSLGMWRIHIDNWHKYK